jgi:hypothetical protein
MKKIAFALQVFTLIAILPLCVILEMNHTKSVIKEPDTVKSFTGKVKATPTVYQSLNR